MTTFKHFYEDMTAGGDASVFGNIDSGGTGNQFPSQSDAGYAPGDYRIPFFFGAKTVRKRKKSTKRTKKKRNTRAISVQRRIPAAL